MLHVESISFGLIVGKCIFCALLSASMRGKSNKRTRQHTCSAVGVISSPIFPDPSRNVGSQRAQIAISVSQGQSSLSGVSRISTMHTWIHRRQNRNLHGTVPVRGKRAMISKLTQAIEKKERSLHQLRCPGSALRVVEVGWSGTRPGTAPVQLSNPSGRQSYGLVMPYWERVFPVRKWLD